MTKTDRPHPGRSESGGPPVAAVLLAYALYAPVVVGFVLHTSPSEAGPRVFGKYAAGYAVFLAALLLAAVFIPRIVGMLVRPMRVTRPDGGAVVIAGRRKAAYVCLAAVLGLLVIGVATECAVHVVRALRGGRSRGRPADWTVSLGGQAARAPHLTPRGWRGPDIRREKPPRTFRIVALGGSTTFLPRLEPDEVFTARLGESLQAARPDRTIEVVNAARDGNVSFQSLIAYVIQVQDFRPDLVVVMHGVNDSEPSFTFGSPPERRGWARDYSSSTVDLRSLAEESGLARPPFPVWRIDWAVLPVPVRFVRDTYLSDLRRRASGPGDGSHPASADRLAAADRALPLFGRNLRTLGRLVQARGARLAIASQPTMYRPEAPAPDQPLFLRPEDAADVLWRDRPSLYDDVCTDVMRRFNDQSRRTAEDLGALFIDLEAAVPDEWGNFRPERPDPVHMSPRGCVLAANALHEAILPTIPPRPTGAAPPPQEAPGP